MIKYIKSLVLAAVLICYTTVTHSQDSRSRWGFGLNAGGQKLYGDQRGGIGAGIEGVTSYRVAKFADISIALGYSQLKYFPPPPGSTLFTDLINADLKGNFDIFSKGLVRPYLTFGLGIVNFEPSNNLGRFFDGAIIGGAGVMFKVHRRFDLQVSGDYRFLTGDQFDDPNVGGKQGKANDGYLNVRAGLAYYLPKKGADIPQVIAMERAPFYELEEEPQYSKRQSQVEGETKDMEEYIKLKSKIDELSTQIDSKEGRVSNMQSALKSKKQKATSLSKTVSRQPSRPILTSSARSDFTSTYEEALTNFYSKQHNRAISLFNFLLQGYPNRSLASSCQYWIGECNLAMGRYQEAIDAFHKVLSYKRSPKKDDSLFQLGKTYLKTGAGERAKASFNRVIRDYPYSEYIFEARDYLSKL